MSTYFWISTAHYRATAWSLFRRLKNVLHIVRLLRRPYFFLAKGAENDNLVGKRGCLYKGK